MQIKRELTETLVFTSNDFEQLEQLRLAYAKYDKLKAGSNNSELRPFVRGQMVYELSEMECELFHLSRGIIEKLIAGFVDDND